MKNSQKIIKLGVVVMILFSVFSTVHAVGDYTLLSPLPGIGDTTGKTD